METTDTIGEEQAIAVRELDPTAHLALKPSERGILGLESADRPEGRKNSATIVADGT